MAISAKEQNVKKTGDFCRVAAMLAAAMFAGQSAFAGGAAYERCIYDSMPLDGAR